MKICTLCLVASATIFCTLPMVAVSVSLATQPNKTEDQSKRRFRPYYQTDVSFTVGHARRIDVLKPSAEGEPFRGIYYYKPLLALKTRSRSIDSDAQRTVYCDNPPTDEWPAYIHCVEENDDQGLVVTIVFIADDAALKARAMQSILADKVEMENLRSAKLTVDNVDAQPLVPWGIFVNAKSVDNEPLGSGEQSSNTGTAVFFPIRLQVPPENATAFKDALRRNTITFDVWLKLDQANAEKAVASSQINSELIVELNRAFSQAIKDLNKDVGQPLFRKDRQAILSKANISLTTQTYATDASLAKALADSVMKIELDKLLPSMKERILPSGDSSFDRAAAEYLKPLINETDRVVENRDITKEKTERDYKADVGYKGGKFNIGLGGRNKQTIEREFGVKVSDKETEKSFAIDSIEYFQWNGVDTRTVVEQVSKYEIVSGYSTIWERQRPEIAAGFTDEDPSVKSLLSGELQSEDPFVFVPPGAMLCYFGSGDHPPAGYKWADGMETWPEAEWVPQELHRKAVPNMNGKLIGGTQSYDEGLAANEMATATGPGRLIYPPPTSEVEYPVSGAAPWGLGNAWRWQSESGVGESEVGFQQYVQAEAIPNRTFDVARWSVPVLPILNNFRVDLPYRPQFRLMKDDKMAPRLVSPIFEQNRMRVRRYSFPESDRIISVTDLSSAPPHYRCRWIIRWNERG